MFQPTEIFGYHYLIMVILQHETDNLLEYFLINIMENNSPDLVALYCDFKHHNRG